MNVLVLSSVFPSSTQPSYGVFVRERARYIARRTDLLVVAPVPWFPGNARWRGDAVARTPHVERDGTLTVHHPRYLCVPGVAKCLDGVLYAASLVPFLARLRRHFPFDVIDAHFAYPDGVAATLLGAHFGCPTVITLRGTHDLRHTGFALRRPQIRRALHAATRLVAVSESLRAFAGTLGVAPDKVRVVPNGVDAGRFRRADRAAARAALGLPRDRAIVVGVGSFVEGKGHHRVVEALPRVRDGRADVLYVGIGAEPQGPAYRARVEETARQLGVAAHVRLSGARPHDEIATWLAAADVFCLATRSEGWCNAITEALACGVPVVSTRVGGNPEIVRDGSDGILVPFWDGAAFADAVGAALARNWDREAIAARAQARGWERTAEQVVEELTASLAPGVPAVRTLGDVRSR